MLLLFKGVVRAAVVGNIFYVRVVAILYSGHSSRPCA